MLFSHYFTRNRTRGSDFPLRFCLAACTSGSKPPSEEVAERIDPQEAPSRAEEILEEPWSAECIQGDSSESHPTEPFLLEEAVSSADQHPTPAPETPNSTTGEHEAQPPDPIPLEQAIAAYMKEILNTFTRSTGYHHKYAMRLLDHPEEGQPAPARPRPRLYGSEVQEVLELAWEKVNCICAKRLVLFLPTFLEALERHEHVQVSETCREQLLSMSAATAKRLLRLQRRRGPRGLSTTRAGTLLKQLIPIRTFQQWNETQPGFVEVDVVAYCGSGIEGGYLSTLALTDIATGWTEYVPLLDESQETAVGRRLLVEQARRWMNRRR